MSMKRYSADSCSVQYFQPYQQYKYVPEYLPECVPEYENWSQCAPAVKTYLFPHDMPNPFFEAVQQLSWTSPDLEQNTSDWQMWPDNENHEVARTSAFSGRFAVAYGTMQNATRRGLMAARRRATSPGSNSDWLNQRYNDYRRDERSKKYNRRGGVGTR
jgi:hypothetical protein